MAIATYAQLTAAVIEWSDRADLTPPQLSNYVALAEARMSHDLSVKALDSVATLTVTGGNPLVALPDTLAEITSLKYVGATRPDIEVTSTGRIEDLRARSVTDGWWAEIVGRSLLLYPTPTVGATITCRGKFALSPLESAPNWLIVRHPNAYLFGTLMEVADALQDSESMARWKPRYDEAISQANRPVIYSGQNARAIPAGTIR